MAATPESLAEYFAEKITSKGNQHIILRIVGSAGTGKSWAGIELAIEVSKCIAEIKGGIPEDYYSFDRDLAIMGQSEVKRVMENPGKYHILHLDDVGVAWNARRFNNNFNIDMNDIIQTFRPNNNLVIMTMQSGFLVDKVPRSLAHYEIEMEQAHFDEGFTIAKVNRIVMKHKTGDIHYPYLYIDGCRYKRHVFECPPKEWTDRYEIERARQLELLKQSPEEQQPDVIKTPTTADKVKHALDIIKLTGCSQDKAAALSGISEKTIQRYATKTILATAT